MDVEIINKLFEAAPVLMAFITVIAVVLTVISSILAFFAPFFIFKIRNEVVAIRRMVDNIIIEEVPEEDSLVIDGPFVQEELHR